MAQPTSSLLTSSGHQTELSMSEGGLLNSTSNGSYSATSHANGHKTSPSRGQKQRGGQDPRNPENRAAAGKGKPSRQVSFGRGVTVPDGKAYETLQREEKGHLTRRNRKKHGCFLGLSKSSWLFLLLALAQAILVMGLQIAIAILGEFRSSHLESYVNCLEDSINITIPDNATFPSFGRDKEIYIYFFIALMVYSFALCLYALIFQNIVEIYTFLIINILAMAYASVQVYQFRGFGSACAAITLVGWLAFANVMTLFVFTIVFAFLSFFIYVEFGWKIYTLVNCNSTIRYYYRVYEVFLSGVKLLILFTVIFSIGQCILLLQGNYEFGLTILLAIFAIVVYAFAYYGVRHESFILSLGLLVVNLLTIGYFTFKIYRYASLTCPLCEDAVAERDEALSEIRSQLNTDDVSFLNRVEEFEHLLMIGAMNLITALIVLFIFLHLWRQYGKGLKDYFSKQPPLFNCKWCQRCDQPSETTDSVGAPHSHGLILRLWSSSKRKKKNKESAESKRDSGLQETFSPIEPEFNPALPTNPDFTGDIEQGMPGKYTHTATLPPIQEESGDSAFS